MNIIVKLMYDFLFENRQMFDLKQYDIDHSIDFSVVPNDKIELFKKAIYLDCDTVKSILDNNMEQCINLTGTVIIPNDKKKSNYYFTLYFLFWMKEKYNIEYNLIDMDKAINSSLPLTNVILCDDFVYSGNQITSIINKLKINCDTVNFYLNVIGMTTKAKEKLHLVSQQNLVHGESVSSLSYPESIFITDTYISNLSTVYLFCKYPDGMSSIQDFRYIIDENGKDYYYDFRIIKTILNGNYRSNSIIIPFYKSIFKS